MISIRLFHQPIGLFLLLASLFFMGPAVANEATPEVKLKLEDIVPADTMLFARFSGVDAYKADAAYLDVFRLWEEPEVQAFFGDLKKMVPQMIGSGGPDFPVKDIWNLFKGEVAVAVSSRLTIFEEGAMFASALAVDVSEGKKAFRQSLTGLLHKIEGWGDLKRGTMKYRDVEIGYVDLPPRRLKLCYATIDNLFVISVNHYLLHAMIDCRLDGESALAQTPSFRRCMDKVAGKATGAVAYASFGPLISVVRPFWPYEFEEWFGMAGVNTIDAVCMATSLDGGGARDSFFLHCPGEKKGLMKALFPHPISRESVKMAPKDSVYFASMVFDPELVLAEIDRFVKHGLPEFYKEFRQGIGMFQQQTGFDLEKDILSPLGSEASLMVTLPQTGGMVMIPDIIASVSLNDEKGFLALQDKVLSMVKGQVDVLQSEYDGRSFNYIRPPKGGPPFSPAFTVDHGRLIVASTPIALKKYLKWLKSGGPGLDESEDFQKAVVGVPDNAAALEYVDLRRVVEMGYSTASSFLPGVIAQHELPFDAGLIPMTESITPHVSNAVGYAVVDEDGILLADRWPLGGAAVVAVFVNLVDYMVENDLVVPALVKMNQSGRRSARQGQGGSELDKALALMQAGQHQLAEELFTKWIDGNPNNERQSTARANRGYCRLAQNNVRAAMEDYKYVTEHDAGLRGLAYYNIACSYSRLNEVDKAVDALQKAFHAGWKDLDHISTDPDMDNIRDNPRFMKLIGAPSSEEI